MEIMGFDSKGEVVVSNVAGRKLTWEEIGRRSVRCNDFFDSTIANSHRRKSSASPISQDTRGTSGLLCSVS
jgi:hypothetical protein